MTKVYVVTDRVREAVIGAFTTEAAAERFADAEQATVEEIELREDVPEPEFVLTMRVFHQRTANGGTEILEGKYQLPQWPWSRERVGPVEAVYMITTEDVLAKATTEHGSPKNPGNLERVAEVRGTDHDKVRELIAQRKQEVASIVSELTILWDRPS